MPLDLEELDFKPEFNSVSNAVFIMASIHSSCIAVPGDSPECEGTHHSGIAR